MDNVTFIDITDPMTNEVTTNAIIDRGNGEFTSMLKSTYDAQQAAQNTLPSNSSVDEPVEKPEK
jgi:hypothetical protein